MGFNSDCVGYRNRTLMLTAISSSLYEAAYTGCRFRDSTQSVLSVRSNQTTPSDQKKELSDARSKLKGTPGLTSSDLVSLTSSSGSSKGLSGGAIAGIVIGVVLFVALVGAAGAYIYMQQTSRQDDPSDYTMMKDGSKDGSKDGGKDKGSAVAPKR